MGTQLVVGFWRVGIREQEFELVLQKPLGSFFLCAFHDRHAEKGTLAAF